MGTFVRDFLDQIILIKKIHPKVFVKRTCLPLVAANVKRNRRRNLCFFCLSAFTFADKFIYPMAITFLH